MKKTKNIIFMSILSICSFILIGMNEVKAFDVSWNDVVCDPSSIVSGQTADCYIIGTVNNNREPYPHGYIAYAYTTDQLLLQGASINSGIANADVAFAKSESTTVPGTLAGSNMPAEVSQFKCLYDSNVPSGSDFGCAVFYTTGGTGNAFKPLMTNHSTILGGKYNGSAILGAFKVKLADDATGSTCGQICVKVWKVPNKAAYADHIGCQTSSTTSTGEDCGGNTQIETPTGNNFYRCKEVHRTGTPTAGEQVESGAFASYSVLIAGALVAISAITIAKKNKKIYKI